MTKSSITTAGEAFSRQAPGFDEINNRSLIINWMRSEVYAHVTEFLQPDSYILELNAGTGVDALYFAKTGHRVLATDISAKMLQQAHQKIKTHEVGGRVRTQQLSYTDLDQLQQKDFDLIYSNFGGLNCVEDFSQVGRHFSKLLKPGGYVSMVMITPFCLWEALLALKGNFKLAFRRFKKRADSNLEGLRFTTTYFRPSELQQGMGSEFKLVALKGLATFTPPPYLEQRFRGRSKALNSLFKIDQYTSGWPLLRLAGDHYIATFQYRPKSKTS